MKIVFWKRRPDGIVINKNHQTIYILKFKQSSDRNEDFLDVKEDSVRLMSNTKASSRRSKRLPRNGRLNRLILCQGGVVEQWKTTSMTSKLPAKLLDYFLRSNKSNINQSILMQ